MNARQIFSFPAALKKRNAERIAFRVAPLLHNRILTTRKQFSIDGCTRVRFILRMIRVRVASKLSLVTPEHATTHRPSAGAVAQHCEGEGAPPRSIPSAVRLIAAAETVPVSAPSAEVRP